MDENKEQWMTDMIQYLAEDIRETKDLTKQIARQADAAEKTAEAAQKTANAAMQRADAAWELVIIAKNRLERPWYKKLLGIS